MPKELDDLHLSAWRSFITAHARLIDRIDGELAAAKCLPLHWYDVLIELYEAPDHKLRLSELAEKVVLSRSGLTRLVDKLEAAGYLRREPSPTDRRGAFAVITDKGQAALKAAWPVYARGIAAYFASHLNDAEARLLRDAFDRILNHLQKTEKE